MNTTLYIVSSYTTSQAIKTLPGPFIGVDKGAYLLAKLNRKMILAIGDFDSVTLTQKRVIEKFAEKMVVLQTDKKETDTEEALKWAIQEGYTHIEIFGGLGGRLDHSIANIKLLHRFSFPSIVLQDDHQRLRVFPSGVYSVNKDGYTYLSFFALTDSVFSVQGVAYPVSQKKLLVGDTYAISNEILEDEAKVIVTEGLLLIIQTSDQ